MFITPSFKKSLMVEQFQGNYLKWNLSISLDFYRYFIYFKVYFYIYVCIFPAVDYLILSIYRSANSAI